MKKVILELHGNELKLNGESLYFLTPDQKLELEYFDEGFLRSKSGFSVCELIRLKGAGFDANEIKVMNEL